jgi:hypothetical protein
MATKAPEQVTAPLLRRPDPPAPEIWCDRCDSVEQSSDRRERLGQRLLRERLL